MHREGSCDWLVCERFCAKISCKSNGVWQKGPLEDLIVDDLRYVAAQVYASPFAFGPFNLMLDVFMKQAVGNGQENHP